MSKIRTAILGATGTVGQRMIDLLENHPWFEVTALAASDNSAGRPYGEVVLWQLGNPPPARLLDLEVLPSKPPIDCDFVFSGLPSGAARVAEAAFAEAGIPVISNASAYRMSSDVPLLIPEVNAAHLDAISVQRKRFKGGGFIVTNPNCSAIGLMLPLAALERTFGVAALNVVTMQALSGAGYPGVASLDISDNVLPDIGAGEEAEKIQTEPLKILGSWNGTSFESLSFPISAMTHRVNVRDGHLEACSVKLRKEASVEELERAFSGFTSDIDDLDLPSAPRPAIEVDRRRDRPQPRLDRDRGRGMGVTIGPVEKCPVLDFRFRVLSHNTIRGAAGAAILNAELLYRRGLIG